MYIYSEVCTEVYTYIYKQKKFERNGGSKQRTT